jgi:uncharacterized membrane protein (UPF0127 family)
VARSFFSRLRGLQGREELPAGEGMLLWPCKSIHCFGMQFPIDVVFMDNFCRVTSVREYMYPSSKASDHQARCVLELCAGEIRKHGIKTGDQLIICFNSMSDGCPDAKDE